MDYVEDVTIERVKSVLKKCSSEDNLFRKNNLDFIYCELMKYNEAFMDKIQSAKTLKDLIVIWKDIAENSFLNWYINPEMPKDAINNFIEIGKSENGLEKQKKLLAELLNMNQLYVNISEIEDEDFGVSDEDKTLNRLFYGKVHNG